MRNMLLLSCMLIQWIVAFSADTTPWVREGSVALPGYPHTHIGAGWHGIQAAKLYGQMVFRGAKQMASGFPPAIDQL